MRDPERIDRMLTKLRRLWHLSPDLRLGQLVSWAARTSEVGAGPPSAAPRGPLTRLVEDDVMEDRLDKMLADKSVVDQLASLLDEDEPWLT